MDIGIAGAGIMGRLLAWQLLRAGHCVSLFDKDPIESGSAAAYTAAGMLTPYSELESAQWLIYQLGMQGLQLWPEIVHSLQIEDCLHQRGSLIVAHQHDLADLERFNRALDNKLPPEKRSFKTLNNNALGTLEPELSAQFSQATYLPEESWLYNQSVLAALADQLLENNVPWHFGTEVSQLSPHCITTAGGKDHPFDWVIDCRGLGAQKEFVTLRGVRGELIWVEAPDVNITRMVRLMHPRYRLYLVPNRDHRYILGATQIESEDRSPISVRSALELLSALYCIHPGFSEARIIATKTNCRPALLDNLPTIATRPGLLRVNGLFRHGFLLAPVLAQEVVDFLQTQAIGPSTLGSSTLGSATFPALFSNLAALEDIA